jgi:hypothetical protein
MISTKVVGAERHLVTPTASTRRPAESRCSSPMSYLAGLDVALYLNLDRTGQFLNAVLGHDEQGSRAQWSLVSVAAE